MLYVIEYLNSKVDLWYVWDTSTSLWDAERLRDACQARYSQHAWRVRREYEAV